MRRSAPVGQGTHRHRHRHFDSCQIGRPQGFSVRRTSAYVFCSEILPPADAESASRGGWVVSVRVQLRASCICSRPWPCNAACVSVYGVLAALLATRRGFLSATPRNKSCSSSFLLRTGSDTWAFQDRPKTTAAGGDARRCRPRRTFPTIVDRFAADVALRWVSLCRFVERVRYGPVACILSALWA